MISEIKYRLGEYIIIEHGSVLLTWVTHIALGTQLSGRCFIIGNILVIGPWEHEEAGYLKLEFYEHLMKLPVWNKTSYYCLASSIRKIGTEQSLSIDLIEHFFIQKLDMGAGNIKGPSTFRLGRYKITVDENNLISWQTIGELNRTIGGTCIIESGILFIVPKEIELDEGQRVQKFFAGLKLLPQWDKTFAWGHYGSLMLCEEPGLRESYAPIWKPEWLKTRTTNNEPFSHSQEIRKARISKFKASDFEWFIIAWRGVVEWKVWGRLSPLIIGGVFFGLRILVIVVGKIAHLFRRIMKMFSQTS